MLGKINIKMAYKEKMKKKKESKGGWTKKRAVYRSGGGKRATLTIKKGEGRYL